MGLAKLCQTNFGRTDLYSILNIPKTSSGEEVRKAYHKISLVWHPDRVSEDLKAEATEKFKVLSKIYVFLSDPEKRTMYDESGFMGDDDDEKLEQDDCVKHWQTLFGQVTNDDISKCEAEYRGSEEELEALVHIYEVCQGDFDEMFEYVLFQTIEDEDRNRRRLQALIDRNEIIAYDNFVNEPQAKRDRRARKLREEAKEADKCVKKNENEENNKYEYSKKRDVCFCDALKKNYAGPKMLVSKGPWRRYQKNPAAEKELD